jgi:hypothetical protein
MMKRVVSVGLVTSLAISIVGGCSGPVRDFHNGDGNSGSGGADAGRGALAGRLSPSSNWVGSMYIDDVVIVPAL